MGKKTAVAKKEYLVNVDGNVEAIRSATPEAFGVRFTFANGEVREKMYEDISDANQRRLMGHGTMQKLGDSYSGLKGSAAVAAYDEVSELLSSDDWTQTREGVGGPRIGQLVQAFARAKGIEVDAAQAQFDEWKESLNEDEYKDVLAKVRASNKIKNAILEIKAEELAAEESEEDTLDTL